MSQTEFIYKISVFNHCKNIPSMSNSVAGSAARKEPMKYTGERRLLGIATMHKSNMVPIFEDNKEEAVEIARMRR